MVKADLVFYRGSHDGYLKVGEIEFEPDGAFIGSLNNALPDLAKVLTESGQSFVFHLELLPAKPAKPVHRE